MGTGPAVPAPGAKQRLVSINGSGGAFVIIRATTMCRRVEVIEDASANAGVKQGLAYQVANDGTLNGFTNTFAADPVDEPVVVRDFGAVIGNGPDASGGFTIPATQVINVRSLSATATVVRVTEYAEDFMGS